MKTERIQEHIVTFFPRLEGLGGLLAALVDHSPLQVIVEVPDTPARILLDLGASPLRVKVGAVGLDGDAAIAGSLEDLHQTFTGAMGIMEGVAQRKLLLRGSMGKLVLMFPVVAQIPVLYGEHLESRDEGRRRPGAMARLLARIFGVFAGVLAYLAGRVLRGSGRVAVLGALEAMSRGAATFSDTVEVKAPRKPKGEASSNPLDEPRPALWRRVWLGTIGMKMYWAGWFVSWLKHRLGVPVDVFHVMGRFSDGVARAQPQDGG